MTGEEAIKLAARFYQMSETQVLAIIAEDIYTRHLAA